MLNSNSSHYRDERVLILAPIGRDAEMSARFLAEAGLHHHICPDIDDLCDEVSAGCGLIFLTGEVITSQAFDCLVKLLEEQPTWSDLPLLVLTSGGSEMPMNSDVLAALGKVGNVALIERPVRAATLLSSLRSALRARKRQYDVRDHLEEEVRNREALRQSESRFRIALDAAQLGAWELDLATNILNCTSICKANFGLPPDAIFTYEALGASIHPEDREMVSMAVGTAIKERRVYRAEYRVLWPDQSLHWILATGRANYDSSGQAYSMVGVTLNITERKKAETEKEHLLQQEQTARAEAEAARAVAEAAQAQVKDILEAITDGFISIDRNWCFTYINRSGAEMAGYPLEYFIGRNIWDVYPDAVGTMYQANYQRAMAERVPVFFEEYLPSAQMWLDVAAYPSPEGLSVFFRDVSERRRIDEEKEKLLASEQAARAEAENSNRLKDEFLATVSHELRTPLQSILGWSGILRSGDVDEEMTASGLETIERNAQAQAQLIDDLLDVSQIITGKLRLHIQPTMLGDVVATAIDAVRPAAQAKNIQLAWEANSEVGLIFGDRDRLQQVIWNLLTNAVKFTPQDGKVQIEIKEAGSHTQIIVRDSGKGIEPEFLSHVFDRFRQADSSSTRRYGGLGLGLSIVRQIVELHGGSVRVESDGPGHGATFTVELPRTAPHSEITPDEKTPVIKVKESDSLARLDGIRVLIVEDEADARNMICTMLRQCGSDVMSAASVAEALDIWQNWKPDVVVSDIGMPGEDGYSFIAKVRAMTAENGGQIPAIALTAYTRDKDEKRALEAGFQRHLPKPIEPHLLANAVFGLAKNHSSQ